MTQENIEETINTPSSAHPVLALRAGSEDTEVNEEKPALRLLSLQPVGRGGAEGRRENRAGGRL